MSDIFLRHCGRQNINDVIISNTINMCPSIHFNWPFLLFRILFSELFLSKSIRMSFRCRRQNKRKKMLWQIMVRFRIGLRVGGELASWPLCEFSFSASSSCWQINPLSPQFSTMSVQPHVRPLWNPACRRIRKWYLSLFPFPLLTASFSSSTFFCSVVIGIQLEIFVFNQEKKPEEIEGKICEFANGYWWWNVHSLSWRNIYQMERIQLWFRIGQAFIPLDGRTDEQQ